MAKTILIVDDSVMTRRVSRMNLEKAGYNVEEAINGADGLRALLTHAPDIIFTDWTMPELTGLQLIEKIRFEPVYAAHKSIPIVVLTAIRSKQSSAEAQAHGVTTWLEKPEGLHRLSSVAEKIIGLP